MNDKPTKGKAESAEPAKTRGEGFKGLLGGTVLVAFLLALSWATWNALPDITEMSATRDTQRSFLERIELPDGYKINLYASGLGRARGMTVAPNGDILVVSPGRKLFRVKADSDGDGHSDGVETLRDDLKSPHGVLLDGDRLYVAETDGVVRFPYNPNEGQITGEREVVASGFPTGSGYWTRTIKKGPNGWFYVTIGASCNSCIEDHPWRAAMIRFQPNQQPEVYATGLRNSVGFDWQPGTGALYGIDVGTNWLGDDFPPDEVNLIEKDGFYGWPYFNGDNVANPDFADQAKGLAEKATKPVHAIEPHSSPLSILFLRHAKTPDLANAALAVRHGSWNRRTRVGFDIISLHWDDDGVISTRPFLTGFDTEGEVSGRPVGIIETDDGTLFLSDDFSGVIWRISYQASS